MKWSQALIPTLKEDPQDAESISHKLMVRSGMIRKLTAGAYTYLPIGFKVLMKAVNIVREEMNASGAQEILMPALQPVELWKKSGRYDVLGDVMIKFKDRHGKEVALGPTHEEIVTDLVASNVSSYKELPLTLYQIQNKFRDEIRPRFGVMRTCEFIMKDAYSFDRDSEGMEASYKRVYDAYCRIFERAGIPYVPVEADPGVMGGGLSHEFMVPSESGEDVIVVCTSCKYAASTAVAEVKDHGKKSFSGARLPIAEVETPGISTVEKVAEFLKVSPNKLAKTMIYKADGKPVALLVRGDHEVNETKLKKYLKCAVLEMADTKGIEEATGGPVGFSGPVGLGLRSIRIIADVSVREMGNFVAGSNKADAHIINVNFERDFQTKEFADLRNITVEDTCPRCNRKIEIKHAIEIGHTFKLGTKYSESLGAKYLDKDGKEQPVVMGCYGIGVNRIPAALIETSNDKDGIIWSQSLAPYQVLVQSLNSRKDSVKSVADKVYADLTAAGYDVLYDDRDERAGVKFKDGDLLGIPLAVVVGEKNALEGNVEVKFRKSKVIQTVKAAEIAPKIRELSCNFMKPAALEQAVPPQQA